MNFKFTISRKISLGFGLFILVVAAVLFITTQTLITSISLTRDINEKHAPALLSLNSLKTQIQESVSLADNWARVQSKKDNGPKIQLNDLIKDEIPAELVELRKIAENWSKEDVILKNEIELEIGELFLLYEEIKRYLPSFEAYNDPLNIMNAEFLMEPGERVSSIAIHLEDLLNGLIIKQQTIISTKSEEMEAAFNSLLVKLLVIFILVLVSGVVIAHFTIRSIVKPVKNLKRILLYLGKGIFPQKVIKTSNDEVGEMAFAVSRLVDGLKRTTEFSREIGKRNFDAKYEPLSEDDELGRELLSMRDDLAENERYLEQKVQERTDEVVRQKEEIENQKEKVTELYKDLTDSINYAKRLQQAILPSTELINASFPDSFVLFKPKSIVSGDFYWFKQVNNKYMFSVVDCTGHGVPGAFMSLVGYNAINQAIKNTNKPSEVMNQVNMLASETLQSRNTHEITVSDGMDMSFCSIDPVTMMLDFSGAFNPAYIIRNGDLIQLHADKFAIGSFTGDSKEFTNQTFKLQANDIVYLFSDGYADQFGGEKGKKFMKKKFRDLLLSISDLPMHVQRKELYSTFVNWQGKESQVDDICVFGVKITAGSMNPS